jgi:hypothetical protein
MTDTTVEGWAFPTGSARKCHYFPTTRRSLCGKYALFVLPPGHQVSADTGSASPDDCAECRRRLEARQQ